MESKTCVMPWTNLVIHPEVFGCCCKSDFSSKSYLKYVPEGFKYKEGSLINIWNSNNYQQLRKEMSEENGIEKSCGFGPNDLRCIPMTSIPLFTEYEKLTLKQKQNYDNLLNNYNDKSQILNNYPIDIEISLDFFCNARCIMCPQSIKYHHSKNSMPIINIDDISNELTQFIRHGQKINLLGGEATISPNYQKFINIVRNANGAKIDLITNGSLIETSILPNLDVINWISISIDASSDETYKKIRRGLSWENLIYNLEYLKNNKKHQKVSFSFIVQKYNYLEMCDFVDFSIKMGADKVYFDEIIPFPGIGKKLLFESAEDKLNLQREIDKLNEKIINNGIKVFYTIPSIGAYGSN